MARHKGLSFYRRKKRISSAAVREICSWIFGMLAAVFIAVVVNYFFGMVINVVGVAMEPTLYNGQRIYINRFVYALSTPKAGDVVVFLPKGNQNAHYYVKRVVAGPGDEVQIEEGVLYVNGERYNWAADRIVDAGIAENVLVMGKGEYFCVGDNVNNSEDSRSANIGPVEDSDIIGKAWFRMPCSELGAGFVR